MSARPSTRRPATSRACSNLSRVTLDSDNVFSDGHEWQVATVTGDTTKGYVVRLTVGVEA